MSTLSIHSSPIHALQESRCPVEPLYSQPPYSHPAGGEPLPRRTPVFTAPLFGLYTILPSPIVYGVWHKHGGSVKGGILRNGRAIVLQ